MAEIVREALIWIVGWVLNRQPEGSEALRLVLLIAFTGVATWASFYWRSLAFRSHAIRLRLLPEERFAGRYLQAVSRDDGIRYAIVQIYYNPKKRRYEIAGRNYSPAGEQMSSFKSTYIIFPSDKDDNIEFVWRGSRAASGHTLMRVASGLEDYIEGDGRIQTFGEQPRVSPMLFKQLHEEHVYTGLGVKPPVTVAEEPSFIRMFHRKLGASVKAAFENVAEEV